jgi:hypothetical protein
VQRVCVVVLVLAMVLSTGRAATAAPILYTFEFVASGTLEGKRFNKTPLMLVVFSDTTHVSGDATNGFTAVASGGVVVLPPRGQIRQGLRFLLVSAGLLLVPQIIASAGFSLFGQNLQDGSVQSLVLSNPQLSSYDLASSLAEIETASSFTSPLVIPLVGDDGVPLTLSIDAIEHDVVAFRADVLGAP